MFTGIVEAPGTVVAITGGAASGGSRIAIGAQSDFVSKIGIGDSVAIDGVCLTAVKKAHKQFEVDCAPVTLERTTIGRLNSGKHVNLELAMLAGGRFGGHFVTGHVDCVGSIASKVSRGSSVEVVVDCGAEFASELVGKGSVTVNGISLTVAKLSSTDFTVAVIPHTQDVTNLTKCDIGQAVNLESDMLGKYVRRYMEKNEHAEVASFHEQLKTNGFA